MSKRLVVIEDEVGVAWRKAFKQLRWWWKPWLSLERVREWWYRPRPVKAPLACPVCRSRGYIWPHDGQHIVRDGLPPSKPTKSRLSAKTYGRADNERRTLQHRQ